jgi:hypothetical protein
MKFPRYWALSNLRSPVACWRWSETSIDDAQGQANARAAELSQKLQSGIQLNHYDYGDGAIREEVVQSMDSAVITRNVYGALVLNTSGAMFIDIDFPQGAKPSGGLLRGLWGKPKPAASSPEESALRQLRDWTGRQSGMGMRTYRTFAGLRALVTHRTYDPDDPQTIDLLRDAGSDPLYIRLCQNQQCFRARLTPKPWRCALGKPASRYPWSSAQQEANFRAWQSQYDQQIQDYSTCRFLEQAGAGNVASEIQPVIDLHDQFACAQTEKPLA